jgi:hypothetical protein
MKTLGRFLVWFVLTLMAAPWIVAASQKLFSGAINNYYMTYACWVRQLLA